VPYYVVNAGRGRSTHIMKSKSPSTPNPLSPGSIAADLLWFGGNPKYTFCGLHATRHVNVFSPSEASCRECRRRWQLALAAEAAGRRPVPGLTPEQSEVQLRRAPKARILVPALEPGQAAKPGRCPRCGRRISGPWAGKHWTDGVHLSVDGTGYCPGPGKVPPQSAHQPTPPALDALGDRRWRAAWLPNETAKPERLGDYLNLSAARSACARDHRGH
jgi:hypothetical protein